MKKLVKLNSIVSMYKKPVLGSVSGKKPIMALAVDEFSPKNNIKGIARLIYKRKGTPNISGFIDRSRLILVKSKNGLEWKKIGNLEIKGIDDVITSRTKKDRYFIGLEDPDIWTDEKGIKHVFFTIAFKCKDEKGFEIFLGHAKGKTLENLKATTPPLHPMGEYIKGFKEVTVSPQKFRNYRINLNEVLFKYKTKGISAISASKAKDMNEQWEYLDIVLDPRNLKYEWCKYALSPCCFFPKSFVNVGRGLYIVIVNGREPKKTLWHRKYYGKFRPGLALFNPKTGEIPWIDSEHLFEDPDAKTITFASDFIQLGKDKGILYCHVNDSFVRAYKIDAKELRKYLKEKVKST